MNPQINFLLNKSLESLRNLNLDSGELYLKQVLKLQLNNPHALRLLGVIAAQKKQYTEALNYLNSSLKTLPKNPLTWSNLGNVFVGLKEYGKALDAYDKSLKLEPNYYEAWSNKGNALYELKRYEEASAHHDKALSLNPNYAEAWTNKGNALHKLKRDEEALSHHDKALSLNPNYAEAWTNKGVALSELKRYEEASAHHDKALSLNPNYAEAWTNKGNALHKLKRDEEALSHHDKALSLNPNYAEAWTNKGVALSELKRYEEASAHYDKALSLNPDHAIGWYNKGVALSELKRYEEANVHYDKAINLVPEYVDANWNKALLKLLLGDYLEAWKLHEWRWKTEFLKLSARTYSKPLWLGAESLANKTILIFAEQGLGDTIQFCRYIKLVSDLGANIIFEVQEPLMQLFSKMECIDQLIPLGAVPPEFDFYCPLLSLPLALKTTIDTIPNEVPYIKPDPGKVTYWKAMLGKKKNLRVGLVWSGGFRPDQPEVWGVNERRNIPLSILAKIDLPGIDFYSLQKGGDAEAQLTLLNESSLSHINIINYTQELKDYSDTAALIDNLDLIISVDTSVAHMAGALGKPVWILNRYDTDWRWLINRSDSPWYQTARIFNQPSYGDWDSVVENVRYLLGILQVDSQ